jgi:hypothetical protein
MLKCWLFFQIKGVYERKYWINLFVEMQNDLIYLIDMCQSCQGIMTHMIWSNMMLIFGGKKMLETNL